jgi:hypothetical protein
MKSNNSIFLLYLTVPRCCFFALLLLWLLIHGLAYTHEVKAEIITFSDFPAGTTITDQYRSLGVVFAGEPQPPIIYPPWWNEPAKDEPTLMGAYGDYNWGSDSIIVSFIHPTDGTPIEATNVGFNYYWLTRYGSPPVTITYYDINGAIINHVNLGVNSDPGIPARLQKFVITTQFAGGGNYFNIDNLSFQLSRLVIKQPKANDAYSLSQADYTETIPITFEAVRPGITGRVNWTVSFYYATSGNRGQYTLADTFSSQLNATTTRTYQSIGGRVTIGAMSGGETARPVEYAYIVGVPIPNSEITNRLLALYRGPTPDLLAKIAVTESSYRQFSEKALLGYTGRWPLESFDGGSHIGLMMVKVTMADAWDWRRNTSTGADMFAEKVRIARAIERKFRKQYPRLRSLTDIEMENMALVLYGPRAAANDPLMQYYIPQVTGNTVEWVKNAANNPLGVAYADSVRDAQIP